MVSPDGKSLTIPAGLQFGTAIAVTGCPNDRSYVSFLEKHFLSCNFLHFFVLFHTGSWSISVVDPTATRFFTITRVSSRVPVALLFALTARPLAPALVVLATGIGNCLSTTRISTSVIAWTVVQIPEECFTIACRLRGAQLTSERQVGRRGAGWRYAVRRASALLHPDRRREQRLQGFRTFDERLLQYSTLALWRRALYGYSSTVFLRYYKYITFLTEKV